ncbi:MAG TPA: protein kinase, partial [Coleofasciculaceae cyanobacterium]
YCSQGHSNDPNNRFCKDCGQQLPLAVGKILDKRYRIVSYLGQGGFGRTYLAEALYRFSDRCVLKEFAPQVQGTTELQKSKELFEREAGVLHQLQHPQLPKFWELFQADMGDGRGCLFLVQDYVEGQTYFDLLKSGTQLGEADVLQFLSQLLPVLSYIHSRGMIHRDISPDNIILRNSDHLPVLIDFGGVKHIAATAISKFTNLGVIETRLGKKGYAPDEQLRQGKVYPSSDLYSLAVTALVLVTGKEPQHLYDTYKGTWRWGQDIRLSPQLQMVLQKMLAHKPGDRFASAEEALKALPASTKSPSPRQTPPTPPTNPNISQMATNVVAPKAHPAPQPVTPNINPNLRPFGFGAVTSFMQTLVVAPKNPNIVPATPSPITPNPNNQAAIQKPVQFIGKLGLWVLKLTVGVILVIVTAWAGWAFVNSAIRSVRLGPLVEGLPSTSPITAPSTSEQNRINQVLSRRKDLEIPEGFFNTLVNVEFYSKHPEIRGRMLTLNPEDTALRNDWHNTAVDILDKLDRVRLSTAARRKLGSYVPQDYQTWKRQAKNGQFRGNNIDQLTQKTDEKFYQLFPQQRGKKLNMETFGQIWYAIFFDQVTQAEQGKP